jgi:hypothetical protein
MNENDHLAEESLGVLVSLRETWIRTETYGLANRLRPVADLRVRMQHETSERIFRASLHLIPRAIAHLYLRSALKRAL